jgi:hypothetical protein
VKKLNRKNRRRSKRRRRLRLRGRSSYKKEKLTTMRKIHKLCHKARDVAYLNSSYVSYRRSCKKSRRRRQRSRQRR